MTPALRAELEALRQQLAALLADLDALLVLSEGEDNGQPSNEAIPAR